MSFDASNNSIVIRDASNDIVFDTSRRMMYIHTIINTSFALPAGNYQNGFTNRFLQSITHPADFILGRINSTGLNGVDGCGTKLTDADFNLGFLTNLRGITFYISGGTDIYVRDEYFWTGYNSSYPSRTFNVTLYAGNYDL